MTNDGNSYTQNGKQYGRVNSDDTICKQVRRLKEMKECLHIDTQWYVSMRNIVKVRWAGVFYDYEKLVGRFPVMDIGKELAKG
jgi:hypothetical protein